MITDQPALRLGNYVLLLELASGGMATVYMAKQGGAAGFERLVVIKRVHRHLLKLREFYDMFCDEARVASLIRHPNVVSVDDVVESDDELFLVLPYVESVSLAGLLDAARQKGETLPSAIVVRIVTDALAGLSAAHEAVDMRGDKLHVVHRDVSPHNILVGIDGRSRIIDFGIAKAAKRLTTTTRDVMKGKLAYMSPEQARQQPLDARADLFAIGTVLYEALTGEQLFQGEDQADVLLSVLIKDIPAPSAIAPSVPPAIDAVVKKSLEREPDDRYQTAADFLESLEKAMPPAQGRDVAQIVDRLCGRDLEVRRAAVRQMLDEPRPSVIPRLTPVSGRQSQVSTGGRRGASASKSDVTQAAAPPLQRTTQSPPPTSGRQRVALVAGGALALGIGSAVLFTELRAPSPRDGTAAGAVVSSTGSRDVQLIATSAAPSSSAPPPSTATSVVPLESAAASAAASGAPSAQPTAQPSAPNPGAAGTATARVSAKQPPQKGPAGTATTSKPKSSDLKANPFK